MDNVTRLAQELKSLISRFEHRSFVAEMGFLANQHVRMRSGQVKLLSPIRQLMYLMSLYHATGFGGREIYSAASPEHEHIIELLNEIEGGYSYNDLQTDTEQLEEADINRMIVTNSTYLNYYLNAPLSFFEQDVDRIIGTFKHFEPYITAQTGLLIVDFLDFFMLLTKLELKHGKAYLEFEDSILNTIGLGKGLHTLSSEERLHFFEHTKRAILEMTIPLSEIYAAIPQEKANRLLTYFTLLRRENPNYLYYTDTCPYLHRPITMVDREHIGMIYSKQLINAIYDFLFALCSEENVPGRKVLERRDEYLEKKTAELFKDFFGSDADIYFSYYANGNEKDLLVLSGKNAFIIECKANKYRMPLRNPARAYSRIRDDFRKSIGKGYEQAKEVEDLFYGETPFEIRNRNKKIVKIIHPEDYENIFTIVVTQERFGQIQCDLSYLLTIEDDDNFPWSVAIDDLETFLITLKRKGNYLNQFTQFLLAREQLQGRVLCYDELELCAYFLIDRDGFVSNCDRTEPFISSPDMNQFFDSLYKVGFGFKNELNLIDKVKSKNRIVADLISKLKLKPAERVRDFLLKA